MRISEAARLSILREVIDILIDQSDTSHMTEKDLLMDAVDKEAQLQASRRVGGKTTPQYEAVRILIVRIGSPVDLIDHAVTKYVDMFEASVEKRNNFFSNSDALSAACSVTMLGASKAVAERVVKNAASSGWRMSEDVAQIVLGRTLSENETMAMVECYTNDLACRGEHIEKYLMSLAERCMSQKKFRIAQRKMSNFIREWNECFD